VKPENGTPSSGFAIRRADEGDLCHVEALLIALLRDQAELDPALRLRSGVEGEMRRRVQAMLANRDLAVFLGFGAEPKTQRVAAGLCTVRIDLAPPILEERRRGEISELYVQEAARRRGLGRGLARTALAHARELGVRRLEVRVSTHNREGQAFWRALGFRDFMDVLDLRL